jgi:transcriptional regulator with XRE-family HTH domain
MSSKTHNLSIFGRRLKSARLAMGLAQDKLGVQIGLDESSSSARMSRYESGVHEPSYLTAINIANALEVPTAYLYCEDDELAEMILLIGELSSDERKNLIKGIKKSKI